MSLPSNRHIVFVYGTLKYGFPNWHVMLSSTIIYLGTARTLAPYPLVIGNKYFIPYMLDLPSHPKAQPVHGELYSVSNVDVAMLDEFEGVPTGFYFRKQIEFLLTKEQNGRIAESDPETDVVLSAGSVVLASMYFRGKGGPEWARESTVEFLQTFPMYERYTEELVTNYVPQGAR